ncbi:Rho GTPase activation protein [Mucor mucedo]|uniref:Rho GTPase activation protein n=1 Tax=Mucor mucedo TaxID=29922 RepID=UPI00221FAF70|nr:Rho GTPase activation protein [Mucor mucedo]KAI7894623.1 Rho GTPase activation protein [Mucor mucedo]
MYPAHNPTIPNQKKKHRNPFTFLFNKQYKSTPTMSIPAEKQGLFGASLCEALKVGSTLWGLKVPDPVALCFLEIDKRGLTTEGIFRLSGATSEVILLEDKINMSSPDERKQINADEFDIHTLTSLVKKYLRELPEPVIPNEFHEKFQDIDLLRKRQGLDKLSSVIVKLPYQNRQLLHAILVMASKIQQHVQLNMMCPEALATVFAPVCTGFEQSLKDTMRVSNSSSTSSTFKKQRKHSSNEQILNSSEIIEKHIKRNKNWTNIWKFMIEQHASLISTLDKQNSEFKENNRFNQESTWNKKQVHYSHHQQHLNRSLPSPFSTCGSTPPLPSEIIMDQFYPMNQNSIPIVQPTAKRTPRQPSVTPSFEDPKSNSISKKTYFFQKSNTIRKILSASTLR